MKFFAFLELWRKFYFSRHPSETFEWLPMKITRLFLLISLVISSSTIFTHFACAQPKTINENITSHPSGADIIWGKDEEHMERTQFETPYNKQIVAESWEPWCYQVTMECYYDSLVVCRPEDFGDRDVSFNLIPFIITIGSELQGWDIDWGASPENLTPSGFKSPHRLSCEDITFSQEKRYFLLKYDAKRSSGVIYYKSLVADFYQKMGAYTKAISLYHESIKEFPSDYHPLLGIANCYYKSGDLDNATKWYLKSTELVPSKAQDIYIVISMLYAESNQCATAEKYLTMASDLLSDEEKAKESFLGAKESVHKCFSGSKKPE
jgi:tetratricopeptide (TPR) repeat protein